MAPSSPPALVALCQDALLRELERRGFSGRLINDLCKCVPDQFLLEPVFEKILSTHSITDQALVAYLVPSRMSLRINSAPHIRNSVFKLIGLNCPHLTTVDLSDCGQVSNSVVRAILQGCPHLQHLALDRCRRITDSAFDFSGSPFQPFLACLSLESISLQGCPQISGELVQTLTKNCRGLTRLNLSQCKQIRSPQLQSLFSHSQLRVLNLSFIEDMCDDAFCAPPTTACALQTLALCKSRITDRSLRTIARMCELLEIRLQWCAGITDAGVLALVQSCPKLRVLDLKSCSVTDETLFAIAAQCPELRELDLSWCFYVTDEGLRRLVPRSGQQRLLERLALVWCPQITDASLEILCELPSLQSVQLSGCSAVTKGGLSLLESHGIDAVS